MGEWHEVPVPVGDPRVELTVEKRDTKWVLRSLVRLIDRDREDSALAVGKVKALDLLRVLAHALKCGVEGVDLLLHALQARAQLIDRHLGLARCPQVVAPWI